MSFLFSKNKKQLEAIFDWLSGVVNQDDLILLEREGKRKGYYFRFPLKFGDKPRKIKTLDMDNCTFWIRFSSSGIVSERNEWCLIFQSSELEIFEREKRLQKNQFRPVRWGLNEEEKRTALKIVRKTLEIFLSGKRAPEISDLNFPLSLVFHLKSDFDVALWTEGRLRGSWVETNKILGEGLMDAAVRACRDLRFKPLGADELADTKIEITLISDLKIPLSASLLEKDEIFHDKGYLVRRGSKEGWFLPQVFNVSSFKTLKEFLFRLGLEKALLKEEEIFDRRTEFFIFEVEDFIESGNRGDILILDGPVARFENQNKTLEKSALGAADWLLREQEPDGNFLPIINPLTGKSTQIDWTRSVFTGLSLIEFGLAIGKPDYVKAGRRNFNYAKKYLLGEAIAAEANNMALSLAYLGQGALILSQWQEALQCGNNILAIESQLKFEPILFLQVGSFFIELAKSNQAFEEPASRFLSEAVKMFEQNLNSNAVIHFAVWGELPNLCLKYFKITGINSYLKIARESADLFLNNQLDSGAFKSSNNSSFVFSRGTGKIAEALAGILLARDEQIDRVFNAAYYKKCLGRAFEWLKTMQYTHENSYFIPKKNLDFVIGGFRHDYFNPELWIDSAAHFILGASRFLRAG